MDVRVAVSDWESLDGTTRLYGRGDFDQGVAVGFMLAAYHFNERRGDVVPVLATLTGCDKNVTLVQCKL